MIYGIIEKSSMMDMNNINQCQIRIERWIITSKENIMGFPLELLNSEVLLAQELPLIHIGFGKNGVL